jgi:HD-GYP domain-containing protein (c-di-GMP phosphodiesterase class II)
MNLRQLVENTEFEHSKNVARISELLALRAGYAESEAAVIAQAALCHDVGKTGIPAYILNKPSSLTREEFEIVKTHTDIGHEQIMTVAEVLSAAARTAREHHERPDGNGYLRLSEREIHPYAKLVAIADVFDALYSKRAYKEAWGLSDISA